MTEDNKKEIDYEPINTTVKSPDDVTSILSSIGMNTFKAALFLFVLFIFISSDVFIDRVLSTSDNKYVEGRQATTSGVVVQGIILSIGYILIDILIRCDYI